MIFLRRDGVNLPLVAVQSAARAQRSAAPAVRLRPMAAISAKTTTGVRAIIPSTAKRRLCRLFRPQRKSANDNLCDAAVTAAMRIIRPSSSSLRRAVSNVNRPRADWFARRTEIEKERYYIMYITIYYDMM